MNNSLHQTAFLNASESKRIFPTTVGNLAVQTPHSIILFSVHSDGIHSNTAQCDSVQG